MRFFVSVILGAILATVSPSPQFGFFNVCNFKLLLVIHLTRYCQQRQRILNVHIEKKGAD